MKKLTRFFGILLCVAMVLSMVPAAVFAVEVTDFTDVKEGDWFYSDVEYVVENGLFQGIDETTFGPDDNMERAMVATVLYRLAGEPATEFEQSFDDVPEGKYYSVPVTWAKAKGVISGTDEKTFSPNANVTREQFVTMLYNFFTKHMGVGAVGAKELEGFADTNKISGYALEPMKWAYGNGIMGGKDKTTLAPDATATRAEVAKMIHVFSVLVEKANRENIRIVCLAPSMVEVVYALGFGDCIVGWSAYTDYPVAATETVGYQPYQYYYYTDTADFDPDYELGKKADEDGNFKEVATVSKFYDYNHTILEALEPTLVLCEGSEQASWMEPTTYDWGTGADIPNPDYLCDKYNAYCWTPESIDEIYDMMIEIGKLLGVEDYAKELVAGYYKRIDEISAITKDLKQIRTYFEIAHQSDFGEWGVYGPYTEGAKTPFDEMIQIAGGDNIFSDGEGYMNLEDLYPGAAFAEIVERDPQVIMSPYWPGAIVEEGEVTTLYEIMTRPDFYKTEAVKTGRVCYYDSSLMKRFGPRTITAIEKLAYLLHPYYFQNPEKSVSPWELGMIDVAENFPRPLD